MSRRPESEEDEYHESEDEDYNPDVDAARPKSDSEDDEKPDASYAELQGRGGLVKTRAQRRAEAAAAKSAPATAKDRPAIVGTSGIDIDALWNEMKSTPPAARPAPPAAKNAPAGAGGASGASTPSPASAASTPSTASTANTASTASTPSTASTADTASTTDTANRPSAPGAPQEEYITITRTFKFAGDVKTETKRVLKASAEGQDYLREQRAQEAAKPRSQGRGPVKRKMSLMEEYQMNKTKKINTLEKSRLDWLGFVDKEGIREDLTKHNKGGYLDKQDFLSRADAKAEQELRQQRIKRMQQQ